MSGKLFFVYFLSIFLGSLKPQPIDFRIRKIYQLYTAKSPAVHIAMKVAQSSSTIVSYRNANFLKSPIRLPIDKLAALEAVSVTAQGSSSGKS